jgi:2-hydroxy-6-oxonona-2,4-dienedioate hydrolase
VRHPSLDSRRTAVGEHQVHWLASREARPAGATPVVLVHGWGVSGRYLAPLAVGLAGERPVYIPDLPGHGRSSKPRRALGIAEQSEVLRVWMDAVGLRRAALLGQSLGCQIVSDFALRWPERVAALVLVGPTTDPAHRSVLRQAVRLLRTAPAESASLFAIIAVDYARAGPRRLIGELRHMLADRPEERLPLLRVPAMVVRGERDVVVPQRWAGEVARLLGTPNLVTIPGGSHAVNYGAPAELARSVRPFLRQVDARDVARRPNDRVSAG